MPWQGFVCTENGFVTKIVNCIFARFEAVKEAKNLLRIYDEVASHFSHILFGFVFTIEIQQVNWGESPIDEAAKESLEVKWRNDDIWSRQVLLSL